MANYLVTGGAGFIGSNIVDALLSAGHKVRVLDNLSTGKKENLSHVLNKIEFIEGSIMDTNLVSSSVKDIDYILHQAAIPSVARSFDNPIDSLSVNSGGTLNMLNAAKEAGVKCFVYASSSSVYGDKKDFKPKSPYGVSKLLGERYCVLYNKLYGLNTVCLRYFNVFGKRQDPKSQYAAVVPKFIQALRNGKAPVIDGDGTQSRDFTFVGNVISANLNIRTSGVYDIGCGRETTVLDLFKEIKEILKSDINPNHGPPRPGDIKRSLAILNNEVYKPKVFLKEGLEKTINE